MSWLDNKSNSINEHSKKVEKVPHLKESIKKYGRNLFWALTIAASIAWAPWLSAQKNMDSTMRQESAKENVDQKNCNNSTIYKENYSNEHPYEIPFFALWNKFPSLEGQSIFKLVVVNKEWEKDTNKPFVVMENFTRNRDIKEIVLIDPFGKETHPDINNKIFLSWKWKRTIFVVNQKNEIIKQTVIYETTTDIADWVQTHKEFRLNLNPKHYTKTYPFVLPEHADSFVFNLTMKDNLIKPLPITINEETDWKIISVIDPSWKKISPDWWNIVVDQIWERNISYQKWDSIRKTKVIVERSPADIYSRWDEEKWRLHVINIGEDEK